MVDAKTIESRDVDSRPDSALFRIDYEARLVEEAVLSFMAHHADYPHFRRELDQLYGIEDMEHRDAGFRTFHSSWFLQLGLGRAVETALGERPIIARSTRCCLVATAPRRRDECAELFVKSSRRRHADGHSVGLSLLPTSFRDSERLLAFLRHEFLHIADMLDPAFQYEPSSVEPDTMHPSLFQERYRALWDTTIDGRLAHEGVREAACRSRRLLEFGQTFQMLGTQTEAAFERLFDHQGHTHPQLRAYALAPETMAQDD